MSNMTVRPTYSHNTGKIHTGVVSRPNGKHETANRPRLDTHVGSTLRISPFTLYVAPYGMLAARTLLFALVQALIAGIFFLQGAPGAWQASIMWWPVSAIATNLITFGLLVGLARQEGKTLRDLYTYERSRLKRDLLMSLVFVLVALPVGYVGLMGSTWLVFDGTLPDFFYPLPMWAAWLVVLLFAPTVALVELPTYFGYSMPRIEALTGRTWLAVLLPVFWLAAQHITLPLVFDGQYMLWRFLAFLPLAIVVGALHLRTRRMIPLMVTHLLIDLSIAWEVFRLSL